MKSDNRRNHKQSHLVWVYPDSLFETLDSTTWIETTQELRQLGWQVSLISIGPSGKSAIRDIQLTCFSPPNIYFLRQVIFHILVLSMILQSFKDIDIILFHQMSVPWLLPIKILRRIAGPPFPLLVVDTRTVPMTIMTWKDRLRAWFYNLMNIIANRWADGQTAITIRMARLVQVPSHKLWGIWPSGVNLNLFSSAISNRSWPADGEYLRLIYIGALYAERNILSLCEAVVQAAEGNRRISLSIIGKGPQISTLQNFADQSNGSIEILSPVPHEQIPDVLSNHHVGVLPFPDQEKFRVSSPVKLFEYMAAGMVILATEIVCHTDVINNEEFVYWAKDSSRAGLYQAIIHIADSLPLLKDKGEAAANAAQSYSWRQSAKKLSDSLERGALMNHQTGIHLFTH